VVLDVGIRWVPLGPILFSPLPMAMFGPFLVPRGRAVVLRVGTRWVPLGPVGFCSIGSRGVQLGPTLAQLVLLSFSRLVFVSFLNFAFLLSPLFFALNFAASGVPLCSTKLLFGVSR
jgi:hypothetical protein